MRKVSKDNIDESHEVSYLKHKIREMEILNNILEETNQKLREKIDRLEKKLIIKRFLKWLRIKFHICQTFPEHVLLGGDGSQYCSICGKQIQKSRKK